jgi:hypothetical protein
MWALESVPSEVSSMRSRDDPPTGISVRVDEPAMLFRISKTYRHRMSDAELYEATRGIWVVPGPR